MNNYKCPMCDSIHSAKEWNDRTKIEYDDNEVLTLIEEEIDMCYFYCQSCGYESKFGVGNSYITKAIEYVTIPKCQYDMLLETKWKYEELED